MATDVLYVKIDSELKKELQRLAAESGKSIRDVAEVVIAKGLGMEKSASINRVQALINERFNR
jgi:predicted transcriptional regulator